MATEEKSRDAFEPKKRYAAVGMQLGRVLVDDDFNEAERIRIEEARRVNLDVVGPAGSPDDGFKIVNGSATAHDVDFEIAAGTFYLGGLRLWNPEAVKLSLQPDHLQQGDRPSLVPDRVDLVYVEAWRQPVTAIEDGELFEVALGGPDTSDRLRTMWRVHLVTGAAGDDCPSAWASVVAAWKAQGLGAVDATGERVVDTELRVTYTDGVLGDLCTPAIAAGYLGAENQTIRVQLRERGSLTWGFDNAAPVYRARIDPANVGNRARIELLTQPRDQVHWPTAGQIVEVLPWSAVLANGEKLAELSGHLGRVVTSYTTSTKFFELDAAVPAGFGESWKTRADASELDDEVFVYVRVWNRGDDHTSPPEIPYLVNTPLALGNTGLEVTITGTSFQAGDHWIIAARPKTPDRVVPWELEDGRRVHGTRRWFAPLALIRWKADGTFELLHDCRPFFLPLTRLKGCCTYTVGDEVSSFGQYRSIQDAIDALPAAGGRVCVLPGTYQETVIVHRKRNVTIEGCGPRSRVTAPAEAPWTILGVDVRDLTIRDLAIEPGDAHGVVLFDASKTGAAPASVAEAAWSGFEGGTRRVRLEGLTLTPRGRAAILALGGVDLTIRGCEILAGPLERPIATGSDLGTWPAILSFADDVRIEDNRVLARSEDRELPGAVTHGGLVTFSRTALGGIQIGGGSERVQIRRNLIAGGNGDGVTLGSWAWAADPDPVEGAVSDGWDWWNGFTITINEDGCIEIDWDPPPPDDPDEQGWVPVSMGAVRDVQIVDNDIQRMGKSGVGVARFFDLTKQDQYIVVNGLEVRDNRIRECVRLPIPELPASMVDHAAQGAITLAEVKRLDVRGNELRDNGRAHVDPVCGVFALISTGVVIEGNRIVDNAPYAPTREPVRPGWRGGVVLTQAFPPTTSFFSRELKGSLARMSGEPTARITDNEIVVPEGRTIVVVGYGPMSIADNHLTTRGPGLADANLLLSGEGNLPGTLARLLDVIGGIAVAVLNAGQSNEVGYQQLLTYNNLGGVDLEPVPGIDPRPPVAASGNVRFSDNQVNVDLLRAPDAAVVSAIALSSGDDVAVLDNQIETDRLGDRLLVSVLPFALSTRVQDNRIKESIGGGTNQALLTGVSIFSFGFLFNMTFGNQTTRCIIAAGLRVRDAPNQTLVELFDEKYCAPNRALVGAFTRLKLQGIAAEPAPGGPEAAPVEKLLVRGYDLFDAMQRTHAKGAVELDAARVKSAERELARLRSIEADPAAVAEAEAEVAVGRAWLDDARRAAARARVEPMPMSEDAAIVHGLVRDRAGHPGRGLTVRLADRAGRPAAETRLDDNGYFRLEVRAGAEHPGVDAERPPSVVGVGAEVSPTRGPAGSAPLVLEVADGERVVHRDKRPLRYKAGKHRYREIELPE